MTTETFNNHDFTERVTEESKIRKGHTYSRNVATICPRCDSRIELKNTPDGPSRGLEHGEIVGCPKCNASLQLFGNALEVTRGRANEERPTDTYKALGKYLG